MKICVITGTRAEYGLLFHTIQAIHNDPDLTLQLIATGMHLSHDFGFTIDEIEKNFKVDKKIEILLSSTSKSSIVKSMGLSFFGFGEAFEELKPDAVLVLGDRFEIFCAVSVAFSINIPIIHLCGGEASEGCLDETYRHCITKMSSLHFVCTNEYKKRVIQLGEHPSKVFNVGGIGIENIKKMSLLSKEEFEKSINFKLNQKNLLITFHPEIQNDIKKDFATLLKSLEKLQNTNLIFTKANCDENGLLINEMIDDFVSFHDNSCAFFSLGQLRYLSCLQFVDAVVGNSSSGILEAPSFKIGTINIGDRQRGRCMAKSIINTPLNEKNIDESFEKLYSLDFQTMLKNVVNPHETDLIASEEIVKTIKKGDFSDLKKAFYNVDFKE